MDSVPQASGPLSEASRGTQGVQVQNSQLPGGDICILWGAEEPWVPQTVTCMFWLRASIWAQQEEAGRKWLQCDGSSVTRATRLGPRGSRSAGLVPGLGPGKAPRGVRPCCAGSERWASPLLFCRDVWWDSRHLMSPTTFPRFLTGLLPCRNPPCPTPAVPSVQTRPGPQCVWTDRLPGRGADPTPCPGRPGGSGHPPRTLWSLDLHALERVRHLWVNSENALCILLRAAEWWAARGPEGWGIKAHSAGSPPESCPRSWALRCVDSPGPARGQRFPVMTSEPGASHMGPQSLWARQGPPPQAALS